MNAKKNLQVLEKWKSGGTALISTNGSDWESVTNINFVDPYATNIAKTFYRAISP